jgi:hypothetical protein
LVLFDGLLAADCHEMLDASGFDDPGLDIDAEVLRIRPGQRLKEHSAWGPFGRPVASQADHPVDPDGKLRHWSFRSGKIVPQ